MDAKVTSPGSCERVVEVDVAVDELTPHFDRAYRKFQKGLKLEGFRRGKVPMALVRKLYGDAIQDEAIEDVVQSVYMEVKQKEGIRAVAPARLDDVRYDPEQGLHFKATVDVVPEIELKRITGLAVEKETYQVDDQDVAEALEDIRERMAVMQPVEGEAQAGHYLSVDFQEIDETGLPLIGRKFENRLVVLSEDNPELTAQLLGVKAGEKRQVTLESVDQDGNPKGDERYEVNVKEIKSKQLPELDDELAKDVGEFESLEALKQDIREKLVKRSAASAKRALRERLIDELLKQNSFSVPESMISGYLDAIVERSRRESGNQEVDEEQLREHYRPTAVWNIRWELARDKVREMQELSVSAEDRDAYIATLAEERNVSEKDIRKSLKTRRDRENFDDDILREKVLDYLEANAKVKEKTITRKDIEKARKVAV